jgi:hypothetical protein
VLTWRCQEENSLAFGERSGFLSESGDKDTCITCKFKKSARLQMFAST